MKITNITDQVPFLWKPAAYRPDGVHLSDILKLMREDMLNQIYPDDCDLEPGELQQAKLTREEGFAWESIVSIGYADGIMPRPEPFQFDGVWMSPDGMGMTQEDGHTRIDEIKWTQSYKPPDAQQHWMWQSMAYCWAAKTQHCRFYVCHTHGTHRSEHGPTPRVYAIEYSWQELAENWMSIINFAKSKHLITEEPSK